MSLTVAIAKEVWPALVLIVVGWSLATLSKEYRAFRERCARKRRILTPTKSVLYTISSVLIYISEQVKKRDFAGCAFHFEIDDMGLSEFSQQLVEVTSSVTEWEAERGEAKLAAALGSLSFRLRVFLKRGKGWASDLRADAGPSKETLRAFWKAFNGLVDNCHQAHEVLRETEQSELRKVLEQARSLVLPNLERFYDAVAGRPHSDKKN